MTKKKDVLGDKLEKAVEGMLNQVNGSAIDVELKLKVFDRALKYYAVKHRIGDGSLGAGFRDEEDKENE